MASREEREKVAAARETLDSKLIIKGTDMIIILVLILWSSIYVLTIMIVQGSSVSL